MDSTEKRAVRYLLKGRTHVVIHSASKLSWDGLLVLFASLPWGREKQLGERRHLANRYERTPLTEAH